MTTLARTDNSLLGRWWWTVDRWTLAATGGLIAFGVVLVMAASPPVAERIGFDALYFARRQLTLLPVAVAIMFVVSLLSPRGVRRIAGLVLIVGTITLVLTLLFGTDIKGARRWLSVGGYSLQASEFVKPAFAVIAAWLFAKHRLNDGFPGNWISAGLVVLLVGLVVLQPDMGMAGMFAAVWLVQFFLAGLPMLAVGLFVVLGVGGLIAAYFMLPHVASRVDRFLDPASGDSFQVTTSLEAFMNGGLMGRGPGEGQVKEILPDAHADFVFAVAGEELGLLVCLLIVLLFTFIVLRGFARMLHRRDLFVLLAVSGLLAQFGLQALVNMASTLNLMPTKGMTLPFISYGGSSLLALSFGMGMVLALTRRRAGDGGLP